MYIGMKDVNVLFIFHILNDLQTILYWEFKALYSSVVWAQYSQSIKNIHNSYDGSLAEFFKYLLLCKGPGVDTKRIVNIHQEV